MGRSVEITLDPACLARVEAYAALRRTTVAALVDDCLRAIGDDFVQASLPQGACAGHLLMLRHEGRDLTASYLSRGRWDEFEQPMPARVFAWIRRFPGLVIDGGANTGFYALLAANASPAAEVLAFEPDPLVSEVLRSNVAANRLNERIHVSPAALSDAAGSAPLFIPPSDHGFIETSSSLDGRFKTTRSQVVSVPTTTVDAEAGERRVTLVKLDLAGHEAVAVRGAERVVARDRPVVIVEALERSDLAGLSAFIARHNYVDVPLRADQGLTAQATVEYSKHAWNHALVPAEKLPAFLLLARDPA